MPAGVCLCSKHAMLALDGKRDRRSPNSAPLFTLQSKPRAHCVDCEQAVLACVVAGTQRQTGHPVPPRRLVERYLLDNYKPHQLSTYALTLYRHDYKTTEGTTVPVGASCAVKCGVRCVTCRVQSAAR
eukprot:364597-Chlamydomonas_euryale.AAC.9